MENVRHNSNKRSVTARTRVQPQAVLVLGMHRSGTSACTRVLNILGCAVSDQLLGAGEGNEAGHWESIEAVTLDDEMLTSAGSSHDDWGPINEDWRGSAIRSHMVGRASEVLANHAGLGPLFAIKDPRMCRLADVWLEAAEEAEIEPLVLLMLRNPAEVTASLEARDLMAPGYAELLWLRHVIDAEHLTRGRKRVICRYDQLMANWQGLVAKVKDGLGITFPRNSPKAYAEIDGFLSHSQRHHVADFEQIVHNPAHLHWLRKTFQIMHGWSERGEDTSDYAALDDVRAEMDRAYSAFARFLLTPNLTGGAGSGHHLRAKLTSLQEEVERKTEALQLASKASEDLRIATEQREAELAAQIDAQSAHARELQSENERLGSEIERLSTEMAALSTSNDEATARLLAELAERTAELGRVQSALSEAYEARNTEALRRAQAEESASEVARELHDEQLRNAELGGRVSALQSSLVQRQEELVQLLDQFHEAERERGRAEAEFGKERELRIKHEKDVNRADTEIRALQTQLDEARSVAKQKVDALTADLAQMTILLRNQEEATEQAETRGSESAAQAARLSEEVRRLSETVGIAETARAETESKLGARFNELARLTSIVAVETDRADALKEQNQWLSAIRRLEESFPAWWAIMPQTWRQRRAHRRYYRAGLFDADAYLALYPDVAAAGMEPVRHYILHGMTEGRVRTTPK